jgi:hypothetical protein
MRRAGVDAFVALAAGGERDLSLAVQLKAAIVDRALHDHVAQHGSQLLVAQPMPLQCGRTRSLWPSEPSHKANPMVLEFALPFPSACCKG